MTDRLLVDLGADARVSVSSWPDGEFPSPAGELVELVPPLDADALEELRWYLEDYLRAPYGVYEERGPRAAAQLRAWGQGMFAAVFGTGPAREQYLDPISLGSLIVSVATLAWTVYTDIKNKTPRSSPAVVARTIRVQLSDNGELDPA